MLGVTDGAARENMTLLNCGLVNGPMHENRKFYEECKEKRVVESRYELFSC